MLNRSLFFLCLITLVFFNSALARTPSPEGAALYIISPANGEVVQNPVTIKFGLKGMGVAPAGVDVPNTGHHHLLIDTEVLSRDEPIPVDDNHRHFGGGQTETTINLSPGKHTLQLILGDKGHVPHHVPVVSEKIIIVVK